MQYTDRLISAYEEFCATEGEKPKISVLAAKHDVHTEHLRGGLLLQKQLAEPKQRLTPEQREKKKEIEKVKQQWRSKGRRPSIVYPGLQSVLRDFHEQEMKGFTARTARHFGVSAPTMKRWLDGKSFPTKEKLAELKRLLNQDPNFNG